MITANDLGGVMAMMPAFTTPDGDNLMDEATINVPELERAVDRMIEDGAGVITTTGTFGECYTLLWDEFRTLAEATVRTVRGRVPCIVGCTSPHTRETLAKMRVAEELGADGDLVGVPYYHPSSLENAVQFYLDIADAFPKLGIMIYHNPFNHRVTLPVPAFRKLLTRPNIVGMKDSHRTPTQFMQLQNILGGKISVFVMADQLYPYMMMGAAGCWSIAAWMGPSPVVQAYRAAAAQDWETTRKICLDIAGSPRSGSGEPNPMVSKLAINEAGYCYAGPLRAPFRVVPEDIRQRVSESATRWKALCETYPPQPAQQAAR